MNGIDLNLYRWYFYQMVAVLFTLFLVYCANHFYLPLTNYFIPDSVHYEMAAYEYRRDDMKTFFYDFNGLLYSIGPQVFTIYNTILLLASIYFCKIFLCISPGAVTWARAAIVFNPYYLISVTGPTKEINLVFLALLSFYLFFKESLILKIVAFLVAAYACTIRTEFGLIIMAGMASTISLKLFNNPIKQCLYILGAYFIVNPIPAFNNYIIELSGGEDLPYFQISIYHGLALVLQEMNKSPILQFAVFFVKLVLGLFAPIARPSTLFSQYIPLLDWGYTFMAIFLFPLNLAFVLLFFKRKSQLFEKIPRPTKILIIYTFVGVLSTLISPIIQFRYLFPYMPMLGALYCLQPIVIRDKVMIVSSVMIVISFVVAIIWLPREFERITTALPMFITWL